jgi:autotransporter translocation and assembly factor TamB
MTEPGSPAPGPAATSVPPRPPGRRWVRWLVALLLTLVLPIVVALVALQNSAVATRFVNVALGRLPALARSDMKVARVRGDWITGLELTGFRLTRGETLLVAVDTVGVNYRMPSLLAGRLDVAHLELAGVIVTTDLIDTSTTGRRSPKTRRAPLTLADVLRGRFYTGPPIVVDRIAIRRGRYGGRFGAPDSNLVLTDVDLRAHGLRLGREFAFHIDSLNARRHTPDGRVAAMEIALAASMEHGRLATRTLRFHTDRSAIDGIFELGLDAGDSLTDARIRVTAGRLDLGDLRAFLPGIALEGTVIADIDLHGPVASRVSGTVDLSADRARWGDLAFDNFQLTAQVTDGRADTRLTTVWAGASSQVSGWIRPFDAIPAYDLEVRTARLPARIPGLAWWPAFAARAGARVEAHVQGAGYARPVARVTGQIEGESGRLAFDGRIDRSKDVVWSVQRLEFTDVDLAHLIGDTVSSALTGTLTASGRSGPSGPSSVNASLALAASHYGEWEVEDARARAFLRGSSLGGAVHLVAPAGSLSVDSLTMRWDGDGEWRVRSASFHDLDLARLTGSAAVTSRLDGRIQGRLRGTAARGGVVAAIREGRASGEAQLELASSQFRGQPIERGDLHLRLAGGAIAVDGTLASPAGSVDLRGNGRPFAASPTYALERGHFTNLDLAAWSGSTSLRSRLTGSIDGHGTLTRTTGASWEGALRLAPSRMAGIDLSGGAHGSWSQRRARITADLRSHADTVSARLEMGSGAGEPEGHAEVSVPLRLIAAFVGRESLASRGSLRAEMRFTGVTPATATADGHISGGGAVGRAHLDSLFTRFHLQRGIVTIDTLLARSNVFAAAGAGQIAVFDSSAASDLHARLRVIDATPLAELIGADTLSVDTTTLEVRLRGAGGRRTLDVRGSLRSLAWNDVHLLAADGTAQSDFDATWRPVGMRAQASLRRLRGIGLSIREANGQLDLAGAAAAFDVTAIRDEMHRLHVKGQSRADSAGRQILLDTVDAQTDSTAWKLARPARIDLGRDRYAIDHFELRSSTGRLDAHGVIDRRGEQDFGLELQNVELDILSTLLGRENLTGTLNGNLRLAGPAAAPQGNGRLDARLEVDGHPAGTVSSNGAWDGRRLDLGGRFATPEGDSLGWSGTLPLALSLAVADTTATSRVKVVEGEVDVRVSASRFPLSAFTAVLDPRTVGAMAGTLDLDLRLRGTSRSVTGNGRIDVAGGAVPLPGLGVIYRDIEVHGAFQNDRLVLSRTHSASGKGTLDAAGDIRFIGVSRIEPRLRVDMKKFVFVDTEDLRAIASGGVDISGSVTSPVVKGKVTIGESNFYVVQEDLAAASVVQLTPADLRMLEENFGETGTAAPNAALAFYDASELELAVTLERNNWVRQRVHPKMSVALTGDFQLKKAPHGEPQLFGKVSPIPNRGYVEQFARSFDITGGEVLLNGPMKSHQVDIQAQYKPPSHSDSDETETVVNLDVDGTIDKLRLVLSSEPAMSEVEIIDFIATGKTKNQPSSSGSDANLAKDIGLSQVTGLAEERAQDAIGLDVLQVRFDALLGATLVAGRYLDPQLYVGFRQPLQYKDTGSSSNSDVTNQTSVEVEYAIHKWLVLNLQGETSKVRSFIRARHAY